jgi:hypothetical protein
MMYLGFSPTPAQFWAKAQIFFDLLITALKCRAIDIFWGELLLLKTLKIDTPPSKSYLYINL